MAWDLVTRFGVLAAATGVVLAGAAPDAGAAQGGPGNPRAKCTIVGTQNNDFLVGTEAADVICGLGGDDVIEPRAGGDVVRAGGGDDEIAEESGADTLIGGAGADLIVGRRGRDRIVGGAGPDQLEGGPGADRIKGGRGADRLHNGSEGVRDHLEGDRGRDSAFAERGDRVREARRVGGDYCYPTLAVGGPVIPPPPSATVMCINAFNQTSFEAAIAPDTQTCTNPGAFYSLSPGQTAGFACAEADERNNYFGYTIDNGDTPYTVGLYFPATTIRDPWLGCSYDPAGQGSGPVQSACIPVFTGDGSAMTASLYFQPTSFVNATAGMGAGQSCTDTAGDAGSGCINVGSMQAENEGEATILNQGPLDGNVLLQKAGQTTAYDSNVLDPGDSWTVDLDPGTRISLDAQGPSGDTSTIVITNVTSYGHDALWGG